MKLLLSIIAIIALSAAFSAPTWAKSQPFYPWYIYPDWWNGPTAWDELANLPEAPEGVDRFIVMNPANGPGMAANPDYVAALATVQNVGYLVYGYVSTDYGRRDEAAVKMDVDMWHILYPSIDGVFYDEASSGLDGVVGVPGTQGVAYYDTLVKYATAKAPGSDVVLNHGVAPHAGYAAIDPPESGSNVLLITFEESLENYRLVTEPPEWIANYPGEEWRFIHIVHSAPTELDMVGAVARSRYLGAGGIYVTDDDMSDLNPYNEVPTYLEEFNSYLSQDECH